MGTVIGPSIQNGNPLVTWHAHPAPGTKLYAAPPKSPGVGDEPLYTADEVEQAMEVLRGRDGSTALCDAVLDEMERTLLAALGGEK